MCTDHTMSCSIVLFSVLMLLMTSGILTIKGQSVNTKLVIAIVYYVKRLTVLFFVLISLFT